MEVTPELRRMIHHNAPTHELRAQVQRGGGLSLRQEGVILALEGRTSVEEVLRVTRDDAEDDAAHLVKPLAAAPSIGMPVARKEAA